MSKIDAFALEKAKKDVKVKQVEFAVRQTEIFNKEIQNSLKGIFEVLPKMDQFGRSNGSSGGIMGEISIKGVSAELDNIIFNTPSLYPELQEAMIENNIPEISNLPSLSIKNLKQEILIEGGDYGKSIHIYNYNEDNSYRHTIWARQDKTNENVYNVDFIAEDITFGNGTKSHIQLGDLNSNTPGFDSLGQDVIDSDGKIIRRESIWKRKD